MDETLLAEKFAWPTKGDVLLAGQNLDLAANDKPATADTVASLADQLVWKKVLHRVQMGAQQGTPDRYRIRTELFKK